MKKYVLCLCLLLFALSLAALQCGEKAVELPVLKYLNGNRFSVAVPLPDNQLRIVTFVHTYARGAQSTVNMLNAWSHLHKSRIRQIVITPDPESDALALANMFRQSGIAFFALLRSPSALWGCGTTRGWISRRTPTVCLAFWRPTPCRV